MKKKLCSIALLAAILLSIGATGVSIIWYTQSPHTGSLAGSDVWSLQRTSPNRYYYSTLSELKAYVAAGISGTNGLNGTNGLSVTNANISYITNLYSSNAFFDHITVTNGITNLGLTANTVIKADAGKALTSIPNSLGWLTNNGSGAFGWTTNAPFASTNDLVWTNNATYIWPVGQSAPTTNLPGPAVFFRKDGSLFFGTNVHQDVNVSDLTKFQLAQISMTDSNEPASGLVEFGSLDSTNYNHYALRALSWLNDKDNASINESYEAYSTNGDGGSFTFTVDATGSRLTLKSKSTNTFAIGRDGNLAIVRGVTNSWPLSNSVGVLTNDGTGTLSWTTITGGTNYMYSTNEFDHITVTNGVTNLSLSPLSIVQTDTNKQLVTLTNGLGLLTNDASGGFGWLPLGELTNFSTLTVISNSYFWATNHFDTIVVTNTITVNQVDYYTNLSTMAPDFKKGYAWISTNAAFTFLTPINVDATLRTVQTCVVMVTNSLGTPITNGVPASIHIVPGSVMYVTNVTAFTFNLYPPFCTNCYAVPLY